MAKKTKKTARRKVTKVLGSKPNSKVKALPDGVYTCNPTNIRMNADGSVRMRLSNIQPQKPEPRDYTRSLQERNQSFHWRPASPIQAWEPVSRAIKPLKETLRQRVERLEAECKEHAEQRIRLAGEAEDARNQIQEWKGLCNQLSSAVKNLSEKVNS